jgi:hypothetical protein
MIYPEKSNDILMRERKASHPSYNEIRVRKDSSNRMEDNNQSSSNNSSTSNEHPLKNPTHQLNPNHLPPQQSNQNYNQILSMMNNSQQFMYQPERTPTMNNIMGYE